MMFDFPSNPVDGQIYAPPGGSTYIFKSPVWLLSGVIPQATALPRNRFVNPAMQVSQENGTTAVTTSGSYAADQWATYFSFGGALSYQLVASTTPRGSTYRLRLTITTADAAVAAGDLVQLYQQIEGARVADFLWGTPQAKQVILRVGFRAPAGSYGIGLQQAAGTHTWVTNIVVSAAEANTDIERVIVIPGPTVGSWALGTVLAISFILCPMAGSNLVAPSANEWLAGSFKAGPGNTNGAATVGNVFELFDMGLYLDPDKTGLPPEWELPNYPEELHACQRYYAINRSLVVSGVWSGPNAFFANAQLDPQMRIAPTVAFANITYTGTMGTLVTQAVSADNVVMRATTTSGNTNATAIADMITSARM